MVGFTAKESKFIIFLLSTFLIGLAVRIFQVKLTPLPETHSLGLKNFEDSTKSANSVYSDSKHNDSNSNLNNKKYIFLNQANLEEFKKLPGIGPVKAERIVQYRTSKGCFNSIEELTSVKGIGEKTIEKLKPFLKINKNNQNIIMEGNR
ncbi:MAG: helix-hairpin-helix domain-containing protein [bacterium]